MSDISIGTAIAVFLTGAICGPLAWRVAKALRKWARSFFLNPDRQSGPERDPYFNREYARPERDRKRRDDARAA